MSQQYQSQRVSDGALLALAEGIVRLDADATYNFSGLGGHSVKYAEGDDHEDGYGANTFFIEGGRISSSALGFELEYNRGQIYERNQSGYWVWRPAESVFIDGFKLEGPTIRHDDVVRVLSANVTFSPPGSGLSSDEAVDQSQRMLQRVTEAASTVVEHTAKRQRELDRFRREIERSAEERVTAAREQLSTEFSAKLAALEFREAEFKSQVESFDDRANTHVRRELQRNMATLSDNILSKPLLQSSTRTFLLTQIGASCFAALLLILATYQSHVIASEKVTGDLLWFGEARVILLGLAAGALIWFFLRQNTARHRQISRWENDLSRFRLDTERASFLIEGDLEARKISHSGLPEVMLDRFSRGLFSGTASEGAEADDASSALNHILNRAALVKVGTDGVAVEIKGSGIRKAQRDLDRASAADE